MSNQISLRAVTQIRKGVTTPRERGIVPSSPHPSPFPSLLLQSDVCSPFLLYFSLSYFFFSSPLLFSFLFVLFSNANGRRRFFERRLVHRAVLLARVCACTAGGNRAVVLAEARVPTSTGERTTCNLLYSISSAVLFYLRV